MAEPQLGRTYRLGRAALFTGAVMLAGAIAAFAAKAIALGWVFLVLMLASSGTGFVCAVLFRNRAVALARSARQEQQARLGASARNREH